MSAIDATIRVTADWLCETKPVVYTGRTKDQPLMADPFPIYQQVVKANPAFFKEVHGYVPDPNTAKRASRACDPKCTPTSGVTTSSYRRCGSFEPVRKVPASRRSQKLHTPRSRRAMGAPTNR